MILLVQQVALIQVTSMIQLPVQPCRGMWEPRRSAVMLEGRWACPQHVLSDAWGHSALSNPGKALCADLQP